jgi:hypothetical protein
MKLVKIILMFGGLAWLLSDSAPRLMSDLWHGRDFVPAQSYVVTNYTCTNWNVFMFNDCTVTFVSLQTGESRQITDWRFGRAPSDPVHLLQRRDDVSAVTTDVSLRTVWNRLSMVLMLVAFAAFLALTLVAREFRHQDTAIGPASKEPALQPTARSTFGRRPV